MDRETFREQMLSVMERKSHWAWPLFTSGRVPKDRLHFHFEQEYETYVRDFPVLVGRAYVRCPIAEIRRSLAENLYEEETGGLVAGSPHPLLFLEYPRGLGMDLNRFEHVQLLPAAKHYRNFLDDATQHFGWDIAAAVVTIFVEGSSDERSALNEKSRPDAAPLEQHPLVKYYGLSVDHSGPHQGASSGRRLPPCRGVERASRSCRADAAGCSHPSDERSPGALAGIS